MGFSETEGHKDLKLGGWVHLDHQKTKFVVVSGSTPKVNKRMRSNRVNGVNNLVYGDETW